MRETERPRSSDPGEEENLAGSRPGVRDELVDEIEAWLGRRLGEAGRAQDPVAALGAKRLRRRRRRSLRERAGGLLRGLFRRRPS